MISFQLQTQFMPAYLVAWLFVWGLALGSLALVMIHHLTGGAWGLAMRRILEAQLRTLPLVALLFIPIAYQAPSIFPWAAVGETPSANHHFQSEYLSSPLVWWRALGYFAIWIVLAWLLGSLSRRQDQLADSAAAEWKCQALSGPGLVIYSITLHFAAIDWMMSIDPSFTSTIYGPIVASGQLLSAFCLALVILAWKSKQTEIAAVLSDKVHNDLGSLLFTLVVVWAYLIFFQAMLIWIADLRHDNTWWLARNRQGWPWLGVAIFVLGFVIPFCCLLLRAVKRNTTPLGIISALVLVAQLAFVAYQIFPSLRHTVAAPSALSLLLALGICALWSGGLLWLLSSTPLVPSRDRNWNHARYLQQLEHSESTREDAVQSLNQTQKETLPQRVVATSSTHQAHVKTAELRHDDGRIEHPSVGHEKSDIRFGFVAAALLLLVLALAIVGGSANWLLRRESRNSAQRVSSVNRRTPAAEFPPQPRLEAFEPQLPADDAFAAADQARNARLHSYGPLDEVGFLHIPIEKAIEHLAKELQSQGPVFKRSAKERGLVGGGDANSGRIFQGNSP